MEEGKITGRQHRIHYYVGNNKILCGVKKWQCSEENINHVECKFCLNKYDAILGSAE